MCIMCVLFCLYCFAQLHTHTHKCAHIYTNTHIDTHPHSVYGKLFSQVMNHLSWYPGDCTTPDHMSLCLPTGVDVWWQLRVGAVLTGGTHLQRTSSGWPGQGQVQPQAAFLPCGQFLLQPHTLKKTTTTPHHQQ